MASKFKHVKLPAFEQESTFQAKVDEWKKTYGENAEDANVAALASHYATLRAEKDKLEEQIGNLNVALEALNQLGVTALQADELDSVKLASGATVYLSYDVYPSVKDKEALLGWVRAKKLTEQLTLPWQTLRGLCNELSVEGKPMPSGVEAFLKVSLRVRNGKTGE